MIALTTENSIKGVRQESMDKSGNSKSSIVQFELTLIKDKRHCYHYGLHNMNVPLCLNNLSTGYCEGV